jgi:chromosome segregation and condensation protein ScpB
MLERERSGRSFALSVTEAFDEYFGISAATQAERRAFLEQALGAP